MWIDLIIGTRPNYIKAFPVYRELINNHTVRIVHTGQHYSDQMKKIFFLELGIKDPDIQLNLISKTESEQLGEIITKLTSEYLKKKPNMIIVFGDVTSTLAGCLVAKKMNIKCSHIESGLRSNDLSMPEEINRCLVDKMADYLFVTEKSGIKNLNLENITSQIYFVGNTMIDTLINNLNKIRKIKCKYKDFIMMTLHRQTNVDSEEKFYNVMHQIYKLAEKYSIIFPVHHRTASVIKNYTSHKNIHVVEPMGYFEFIAHIDKSSLVITDSGGIQEETSYLGIPCLTIRESTERPVTLNENSGTSFLCDIENICNMAHKHFGKKKNTNIELWDGKASQRISNIINSI